MVLKLQRLNLKSFFKISSKVLSYSTGTCMIASLTLLSSTTDPAATSRTSNNEAANQELAMIDYNNNSYNYNVKFL